VKTENAVQEKSFAFAVRIVNLYKHLVAKHRDPVLFRQILKSGTSIGAYVEEALGGVSRDDFSAKIGIAYKETRETIYWLRLFKATDYLSQEEFDSIMPDAEELRRIITAIQLSLKSPPRE
jgi:four helix bundle protein